jgi:hypothetical protein
MSVPPSAGSWVEALTLSGSIIQNTDTGNGGIPEARMDFFILSFAQILFGSIVILIFLYQVYIIGSLFRFCAGDEEEWIMKMEDMMMSKPAAKVREKRRPKKSTESAQTISILRPVRSDSYPRRNSPPGILEFANRSATPVLKKEVSNEYLRSYEQTSRLTSTLSG